MDQMTHKEGDACCGSGMCGSSGCGTGGKNCCKCMHHKVPSLLVVLFGLLFLLKAWDMVSMGFVDVAWPVLVILLGLMKLTSGKCKCC